MIFICSDTFGALVRLLSKDLRFLFLKCSHMLVDECFKAGILQNSPKWKTKITQWLGFFFPEFSLFSWVYPSFVTWSSYDLSLFGLLITADACLTRPCLLCWGLRFPFSSAMLFFLVSDGVSGSRLPPVFLKTAVESKQVLLRHSDELICHVFSPDFPHK